MIFRLNALGRVWVFCLSSSGTTSAVVTLVRKSGASLLSRFRFERWNDGFL